MNQYQKILRISVLRISFYIAGTGLKLQLPWDAKWSEMCESPAQPNLYYCPAPLPTAHSVVKRKISSLQYITKPHRGRISQHFYHYSSWFSKNLKAQCHKIFQKLTVAFAHKRKKSENLSFVHFKKLSTKQNYHWYLPISIRTRHNQSLPDPSFYWRF
jgi:hypothetical protein